MKITKNWLYKLSEIIENSIIIWDNLSVVLFDEWNIDRKIKIWCNSRVEIYWFLNNIWEHSFDTELIWENSTLKIWYLLLSWNKQDLKVKIYTEIWASNSSASIKIISIVWNNQKINLDWTLKINTWLELVKWNLSEENIFLWETWIINCIPSLLVWSDNIEASHSCKIERINDEKLFYLRSRWVNKNNALNMMLESYIKTLFKCLWMLDKKFYEKITNNIIKKIEK
jgi:Fe-S cluster assembly scaffold protein SufB